MRIFIMIIALFVNINLQAKEIKVNFNDEVQCLAINIYHEARSEPTVGMASVADVVINRVKSVAFPNNVCDVIKQGPVRESWRTSRYPALPDVMRIYYPVRGECHFSWWCDGRSDEPTEVDSWARALDIATMVLNDDKFLGITDGADHYFANWIDEEPQWAQHMVFVGNIGNHKFYRSIR